MAPPSLIPYNSTDFECVPLFSIFSSFEQTGYCSSHINSWLASPQNDIAVKLSEN